MQLQVWYTKITLSVNRVLDTERSLGYLLLDEMDVEFSNDDLERAYTDPDFTAGLQAALLRAFRKVTNLISRAKDERDFYAMRSLNFEELQGKRRGDYSMRLNKQFRLVMRFEGTGRNKRVRVINIEDYH